MTSEIATAVDEIRQAFPNCSVNAEEDGQGGCYVTVSGVEIGARYIPQHASFSFHIGFQYPRADVYPHYTDVGIKRVDGGGHGGGVSQVIWRERSVLQLSRRSNRWSPANDTAAIKLAKVVEWFKNL